MTGSPLVFNASRSFVMHDGTFDRLGVVDVCRE